MPAALDTSEIVVAAGSVVASAPAGTALPALGTFPAAPWVDLGYISEDGVTWTESPEEETLRAWQSPDPVKVILTALSRTFGFALMQWDPKVLEFVIGGVSSHVTGPPVGGQFVPSKSGRPEVALVIRWLWETYETQLYVPRGKVTGDVDTALVRSTSANFAATFTATPSGAESAYTFQSLHPTWVAITAMAEDVEADGQPTKAKSK